MDYAWDTKQFNQSNLQQYTQQWITAQFGATHADEIARIISLYTKFNSRRKPELLSADTYSLVHYREAERIVNEYNQLALDAQRIYGLIPSVLKDAYYQLVLHPVKACANLNELYFTVAKNHLYAMQGRASTNELAQFSKVLFDRDAEFSRYYNKELASGKWNNMMNQTHISYTTWQQPEKDVLPEVKTIDLPNRSEMGVAIEGSALWWPLEKSHAVLPEFDIDNKQHFYIDVFNRGSQSFDYTILSNSPWVLFSEAKGTIEKEKRIDVSINWKAVASGNNKALVSIKGSDGSQVDVQVMINNTVLTKEVGFIEHNGYISMEADHFSKAVNTSKGKWTVLPDHGRTGSSITTFPVTVTSTLIDKDSPYVEYPIYLADADSIQIQALISPTIDFHNNGGLHYAVSLDDEVPQVINIHQNKAHSAWQKSVRDNVITSASRHGVMQKGEHVLKFWRVDAGVVLQKIIVDGGGLKPSYLGPPESYHNIPAIKN